MKNLKSIISIFILITFSLYAIGQTPLEEAIDFQVTDVNGNEIQLFQLLDEQNKYVLIDFFFTTCAPCQTIAPRINETYEYFGCGEYDIEYIAIDWGDTQEECIEFDYQFGINYPTVSGLDGGGDLVINDYQIPLFPTVILIAPDHTIAENQIYVPTAESLINLLETYDISANNCSLKADFFPFNNDICPGEYILFHDHSVGNIDNWEWTFEGGIPPTSNDQNPVIFYPNTGEFDVGLNISNENEESELLKENIVKIHNCTGINNNYKQGLSISPNPANNYIEIKSDESLISSKSSITIYKSNGGKTMHHQKSIPCKIDISDLDSGIYFIDIFVDNNKISRKFIKTKN